MQLLTEEGIQQVNAKFLKPFRELVWNSGLLELATCHSFYSVHSPTNCCLDTEACLSTIKIIPGAGHIRVHILLVYTVPIIRHVLFYFQAVLVPSFITQYGSTVYIGINCHGWSSIIAIHKEMLVFTFQFQSQSVF